jgi:hypothetical protein
MKRIYILHTIALLSILIFVSCDKDVLEQSPVDSFNEESLFQDVSLVEAFLVQCYDGMGGSSSSQVLGNREDLLSSATDETLNIHRAGNVEFLKGTLTPDELGHFGDSRYSFMEWNAQYTSIKDVNTLLGGIDKVPAETQDEKDLVAQIKAEAYFIRAFNYTNLLRSYGGVVLVDQKFNLDGDFSTQERAGIDETLAFILTDIDKAIEGLPLKDAIEQGRATKGAAAALKSRLLSFVAGELANGGYQPSNALVSFQSGSRTERLTNAKNAAKKIMDGEYGTYALDGSTDDPPADMTDEQVMAYSENYYNIFMQKGKWSDEVIWGVQYLKAQGNSISNNLWWGPNGYNCWGNNEPFETTVRQYEMKDGTSFEWDKYNPGDIYIREFTQEQFATDPERNPYVGREPRFYASVLYDEAPWYVRASTNNKIQSSYEVNAPGAGLMGKNVADKMAEIAKLESVIKGGSDTRSASSQAWNGTKTGYYLKKMLDIELDGNLFNNENAWIEFRFAEVVLDYAEACIELGEVEEGLNAVNLIRNRAGLPDRVTTDQELAREYYRHERFIEMMAEGDRWYSIRKWMICDEVVKDDYPLYVYHFNDGVDMYIYNNTTIADAREWVDRQYWMPISRTEINKAPQLEQNPGYE